MWLDYKAKADKGWTQQRIADGLGVSRQIVGFRLQMAELPELVLQRIATSENISERDCRELIKLLPGSNSWFQKETFLLEIIDNILSRTTKPTSKHFQREVETQLERFDNDGLHREKFLLDITGKKARTKAVISNQANTRASSYFTKSDKLRRPFWRLVDVVYLLF